MRDLAYDNLIFNILESATFLWLLIWAVYSALRLINGFLRSSYVLLIVIFILMGLPLLWDQVFGPPHYLPFRGLAPANADQLSRFLYCVFLWTIPLIVSIVSNGGIKVSRSSIKAPLPQVNFVIVRGLAWISALIPIITIFFSPAPRAYLQYGTIHGRYSLLPGDVSQIVFARYHVIVSSACLLSIISVAFLVYSHRGNLFSFDLPLYVTILAADIWINGKRNAFAFAIFLFLMAFWSRGSLRPKHMALIGVLSITGMLLFSVWYQQSFRSANLTSASDAYNNLRIDFGRDHTNRLAIYRLTHPDEEQILSYPGQSIVIYSVGWIPRSIWQEKPPTYATLVTSAALLENDDKRGWSITTSWFDEAISNFGYLGFVLGPATLGLFCRIGDSKGSGILQIITMFAGSLFVAVHLQAFLPVVLLWITIVIASRLKTGVKLRGGPYVYQQTSDNRLHRALPDQLRM